MIHEIMLFKGRRNPKKRYRDEIKEKNYFCVFIKKLQIYTQFEIKQLFVPVCRFY